MYIILSVCCKKLNVIIWPGSLHMYMTVQSPHPWFFMVSAQTDKNTLVSRIIYSF